MKRLLLPICALAILATSCGSTASDIDSDAVVAHVLAAAPATTSPVEAPPPSIEVPPGCRLVTELDEYGFEVEVIDCGDEEPAPPGDDKWLGSDSAVEAAILMRKAILQEAACGTATSHDQLREHVARSPMKLREPLLAAIAALERGAQHCNQDRDAWAEAMSAAITHLEEFVLAAEPEDPGS